MFVNVQIPDEVYARYAERKPERPQVALADTLREFVGLVPGERRLVLSEAALRALVGLYQDTIEDEAKLLKLIKRDREVNLAGLEIPLTEAQRRRLKAQSAFMKHPSQSEEEAFREYVVREIGRAVAAVAGI